MLLDQVHPVDHGVFKAQRTSTPYGMPPTRGVMYDGRTRKMAWLTA